MKFIDVDIDKITERGYDKILVMRNGEMLIGGSAKNVAVYQSILKDKEVISQFSDEDIWIIEVKD